MGLRAGRAPASAVYETAASLPMLAENNNWLPGHESHMRSRFDSLTLALRVDLRSIHLRCAPSETAVLLLDDPAMAED